MEVQGLLGYSGDEFITLKVKKSTRKQIIDLKNDTYKVKSN